MPLVVIGGIEYGAGSSRDWAAKGTALLGVKAVIAESFERIHRSNLVGMGVIPFEFTGGDNRKTLGLKGDETISISGLAGDLKPLTIVPCTITYGDGTVRDDRARSAGSIPRSRSSTSRTAGCCTTCCAIWPGGLRRSAGAPRGVRGRQRRARRSRRLDWREARPAARTGGPEPESPMRLLPPLLAAVLSLVPLAGRGADHAGGARALHQPGLLVLPAGRRAPDRARRPRGGDRAGAARGLLGLSRLEGRVRPAGQHRPAARLCQGGAQPVDLHPADDRAGRASG